MTDNKDVIHTTGEPTWPKPDDPEWADCGEQTLRWLEATQPEALASQVSETISDAFHVMSRLAMTVESIPKDAWENALAQLPAERADILREQLEFAASFSQEQHATRGAEGNLSDSLFALVMSDLRARPEPIAE